MIKKYLLLLALLATPFLMVPSAAAQKPVDVFGQDICSQNDNKPNDTTNSTVCKDKNLNKQNPLYGQNGIITTITNLLTAIVAIVAVIIIILAGLKFITSGSNPQDVTKAREQIIYACVGLVIAGLAQAIVRLIINRI